MQHFRKAIVTDADVIAQLVNSAYRGESSRAGWTTEADLLDGLRVSASELRRLMESANVIIVLCFDNADLIGSICIENEQDAAQVGMFVVKPTLQGRGVGKQLLATAENLAYEIWAPQKFQMHVITLRHELIAFYVRRGYLRTGILSDFPVNAAMWQPKLDCLKLETLEKYTVKQSVA